MGQGWLYGRPLTADRIPEVVTAASRTPLVKCTGHANNWVASNLEALPVQRLAQLQAIFDGAPVGLCFLDCNLRYVSINQRLADMNGHPVDSHFGRTSKEMIPKLYPRVEPYLLRALQGEAIHDVEVLRPANYPWATDTKIVCSYQPAFDEAGEVIGVSVAVVDRTGWTQAHARIRGSVEQSIN
jgi:PAS domain-containing protein